MTLKPASFGQMMSVSLLVLAMSAVILSNAMAQERLGLHVTQKELNIWRQRRTDNVSGIGGVSFQSMYSRILADANTFKSQSHPGGDGWWAGYTPSSPCNDTNASYVPSLQNGRKLMASAFHFLLTGDKSYADPVKTELLVQIANPNTDFTNTSKWCPDSGKDIGQMWRISPWITRLLFAYDYLNAGGYSGLTAQNKTDIETWFNNAGVYWAARAATQVTSGRFSGRDSDYVCDQWACPSSNLGDTHWNGHGVNWFHMGWNNRISTTIMLAAASSVLTGNTTLKNEVKLWLEEFVKFAVFPDGTYADLFRWHDHLSGGNATERGIGSAWTHAFWGIGSAIVAADHLARDGDTKLYDLSTSDGQFGSEGKPKSLGLVSLRGAQMANNAVQAYATTVGAQEESTRIRPSVEGGHTEDYVLAIGNLYYQQSAVTKAYSRRLSQGSGCGGTGCEGGAFGAYPHVLFMFGQMEGNVWPYPVNGVDNVAPTPPANLRLQ